MESAIRNRANRQLLRMQIAPSAGCSSLHTLDEELDNFRSTHEINERSIERFLNILEESGASDQSIYWLIMVRIFELALFCAGNYADNCEFSAAGDLLVNPRDIFIHIKSHDRPLRKKRRGKISEQLNPGDGSAATFIRWFRRNATLEVGRKALLEDLYNRLETSGRIASAYLANMKKRMNKIADTIGFLASWQIDRVEKLVERMRQASPEERDFFNINLCHFDPEMINLIGREIRRLKSDSDYHSPLLAAPAGSGPAIDQKAG
jgi:hypothetical protein